MSEAERQRARDMERMLMICSDAMKTAGLEWIEETMKDAADLIEHLMIILEKQQKEVPDLKLSGTADAELGL